MLIMLNIKYLQTSKSKQINHF